MISPASYTVTVSLDGYTTITSTLSLAADQQLTNVRVALSKAAGTLAGTVTTASDNKPAGGVSVTVTAGCADGHHGDPVRRGRREVGGRRVADTR